MGKEMYLQPKILSYTMENSSPTFISFRLTWNNCPKILWFFWEFASHSSGKGGWHHFETKNCLQKWNKVHIVQDFSILVRNVNSRLRHHGKTNTFWHISNHKINKPLCIHLKYNFLLSHWDWKKNAKKLLFIKNNWGYYPNLVTYDLIGW
jgi:hypothetical protein